MRVSCIQTPTALDSVLCKVHSLINIYLSCIDFISFSLWFFFQLADSRLASRAICERATHAWRKDGDARVPQASAIRGDYAARRLPSRGRWHPSPRYRRSCDWRRAAAYARTLHAARHSVRASRFRLYRACFPPPFFSHFTNKIVVCAFFLASLNFVVVRMFTLFLTVVLALSPLKKLSFLLFVLMSVMCV
jgi:hypothetical protein